MKAMTIRVKMKVFITITFSLCVKDARLTQTYSFLPAFWAGDTHEETDFLPIGDQEEKEK